VRLRLTPLIAALALVALAPLAHAAPTPRIVVGHDAGPYPSMAALVFAGLSDNDGQFCGATVIAPYAVLTAAHCLVDDTGVPALPAAQVVLTGKSDLLAASGGQHLAVRQVVIHPAYDPGAVNDDVAVLLLAAPTAAPVMPRATSTPAPGPATAIGWGATNQAPVPDLTYASKLQEASMPVQAACDEAPKICTSGAGDPGLCFGDSGGPLLVTTGGVTRQAGIASTILTSDPDNPICGTDQSLFTDVSLYNAWIDAQLAPAVSGVTVSALPGKLHVTWQRAIGGAEPAVVVTTSDGTFHSAPAGATSLDIAGLPLRTALSATVTVTNTWGAASASSAGTATLVAAPGIAGVAATAKKVSGNVATNGVATTVIAQYGPDVAHLTKSAPVTLADAAGARAVGLPVGALPAGRTYRARLVATNSAGTTISGWVTFKTPATKPVSTTRPKVTGTPKAGKTLTCGSGKWKAAPAPTFAYGWRIGGKVSKTQKKSKLKLTDAMVGKTVSCVVTAKNPAAAVAARSVAVTVRHR
jgi:secreted trypsin-like serine protease